MLLKKYLNTLDIYKESINDEDELVKYIDKTFASSINA